MIEEFKDHFDQHVKNLQEEITAQMEAVDPGLKMIEDHWVRKDFVGADGGGGKTRAFTGKIFENAGVNTSCVHGEISPEFAKKLGGGTTMWAAGISLIIHPISPRIPTVHANFRMIQSGDKFWFGGGADLTPFYPHPEDFQYFHETWKKACAPFQCYDWMKKESDDYITNHHRTSDKGPEMRGVGGIFFDHYNTGDLQKDFDMVTELSRSFIPSYFPMVNKRLEEEFSQEDVDFQLHRRGRYVEFNLLHDRGTMFGLKTNGRVDSILISLPGRCKFSYAYQPKENSMHAKMMSYYYPQNY